MALVHPSKRWSLTFTVTPTPLLYYSFSFCPKSMVARREGHNYFFRKKFSKFFWGPFPGPRGFCPSFSNSPSPAAYPQTFSDVSTFIFASFFNGPSIRLLLGQVNICFRSKVHDVLHFFQNFSKFLALFWCPRVSYPLFWNSPSPATYPHIFSNVSTSFLNSFFTVVPKGLHTQGTKSNTP